MSYNPHLVVRIFNRAGRRSGKSLSICPYCHGINESFYRQFRTKKRLAEGLKPNVPPDGGGGGLGGRSLLSSLSGPLVFTVGFSGVAISAAAVWQYENMRTREGVLGLLTSLM